MKALMELCICLTSTNASEYSFGTVENTVRESDTNLRGLQGGYVHTVAQACDGMTVFLHYASGNITSGTFTLYRTGEVANE